ncbi:MAG TPA: flippase activity-associated protein Agl23 [Pyrinomonadaceae bacterium]|nr:flippase activity-associated protein Agl23 [Pyrinomonadaceae bacterium]
MSTVSTKSRPKKRSQSQKNEAPAANASDSLPGEISQRTFRISAAAILIVGAFLRLYHLALVPLHHDEGVNGNFLVSLVRNGTYTYDPQNYHGPTLYYFSAILAWIARFFGGVGARDVYGLTTFNIRFVTAAFGIATIGLVFLLRKRLGAIGALSAGALMAVSPGAVYLSRYFIHESLFVFFMMGVVVAAVKYYDTGAGIYLILAAISAALMTATKETWIINAPVLLIALITTNVYFWSRKKMTAQHGSERGKDEPFLARFGGPISVATVALVAFTLFIVVNVLFYSSFFSNYPKGVNDSLQTLALWRKRTHEHAHPWYQYVRWLLQKESIVLVLGGIGALIALWRADNRLALFVAQWAFGLLAAYSLVGYKTPWIALNFIVPLALTSGYTLDVFYRKLREFNQPIFFLAPAVLIVAFCGYQMYQLNFVYYDDDKYVYVYAHTRRETLVMLDQIDQTAAQMKTGHDTGVAIVSPEYWPLPWYFRDYKRVGYYQKVVTTTEPVIIGSVGQEEEIKATYGDQYQQIDSSKLNDPRIFPDRNPNGSFSLRPGVDLLLYVRKDVAK